MQRDDGVLIAAQVCYLEGGWRESDCVALLHVARKRAERADRPWLVLLREYSAIDASNARAREVRTWPWGDISGKSLRFNQRWAQLRELVVQVLAGEHKDPCPRARHGGGTMDEPRGRMVPARCAAETANTFYAVTP